MADPAASAPTTAAASGQDPHGSAVEASARGGGMGDERVAAGAQAPHDNGVAPPGQTVNGRTADVTAATDAGGGSGAAETCGAADGSMETPTRGSHSNGNGAAASGDEVPLTALAVADGEDGEDGEDSGVGPAGDGRTPSPLATPSMVRKTDRYGFFIIDKNGRPVMHTPTNSAEDALRGDGSRADAASQAAGSPVRSGAGAGAGAGAVGSAASAGPSTPVVMERPLSSKVPLTPAKERERIRLENSRTEKWRGVMQNWKLFRTKKQDQLKKRIRKGIPEAMRGPVWMRLVGAEDRKRANKDLYPTMLRANYPTKEEVVETIERDISRTFPRHAMFAQEGGIGQSALMRVLRAYAAYDQKVGYCQGMGFIAAMFLSYMPEEDAFFLLLTVLQYEPHKLAGLFSPGMPRVGLVHFQFHGLMEKKLPKLTKHLEEQGLHPTIFASQWFITVFTYNFHFEFSTRVWDCFLSEGWKVAFRVGLALLKASQRELLSRDFEGIMTYFHDMPKLVDVEKTLKMGFSLSLKRTEIDALEKEYERQQLSTIQLAHATAM